MNGLQGSEWCVTTHPPSGTGSPLGWVWCSAIDYDAFVSVAPSSAVSIQPAGISRGFFLVTFLLRIFLDTCVMKDVGTDRSLRLLWLFQNPAGIKGCFTGIVSLKQVTRAFGNVWQAEVFHI